MDIQRCYETLELEPGASIQEVRQAYKDMVNIWHPDRVSNNPRLKQKAEEKLKQINAAHERLLAYLDSRPKGTVAVEKTPQGESEEGTRAYGVPRAEPLGPDRPETSVKTGPGIVATLWSYLSDLVRSLSENRPSPGSETGREPYSSRTGQGSRRDRAAGGGTGPGRGRGMGRGGRGMGRGKGMGGGRGRR